MKRFLAFSNQIDVLPVVHGSGDFAVQVREQLLGQDYDCLAIPLPASFLAPMLEAIELLPTITAVVQLDSRQPNRASYVPIDPCQPVIAAVRCAVRERIAVECIDLETRWFPIDHQHALPDAYALKSVSPDRFAAAVLPALSRPKPGRLLDARLRRMAFELHRLELQYRRILFVPSVLDWIWIREAFVERRPYDKERPFYAGTKIYRVDPATMLFFLGELPFVTELYEQSRITLDPDQHLSIDGIKELLLETRSRWIHRQKLERHWLTPKLMQAYLQYVRNWTLMERRLSPDLYTLVVAAKQIAGDGFALELVQTAREYRFGEPTPQLPSLVMGIEQGELGDHGIVKLSNRLPGPAREWRQCQLIPEPPRHRQKRWQVAWNPFEQCSWPPEDNRIESFQTHVREQAKLLLSSDLIRTEKFTSSVKDGIDLRDTLRHWHTGELYVREIPPARGSIDVVVFLFDVPADPNKYGWRATWQAEHNNESTIGLFATNFTEDIVGPGIGRARYGGVFFLFPARIIANIWHDRRIPKHLTLEEHLLAAACLHAEERHVALVSPILPTLRMRRLAKQFGKRLIHLPLSRFSAQTVDRLRTLHVLNGRHIRSYAAQFIREG